MIKHSPLQLSQQRRTYRSLKEDERKRIGLIKGNVKQLTIVVLSAFKLPSDKNKVH